MTADIVKRRGRPTKEGKGAESLQLKRQFTNARVKVKRMVLKRARMLEWLARFGPMLDALQAAGDAEESSRIVQGSVVTEAVIMAASETNPRI